MKCLYCESEQVVKNGINPCGTQKYICKECDYQFVENPKNKIITQYEKDLIDKLLLEKISLAGISRVLEISETWLQHYVNNKFEKITKKIILSPESILKSDINVIIECDEMWSFVGKKK